jgi:hypothetical protein
VRQQDREAALAADTSLLAHVSTGNGSWERQHQLDVQHLAQLRQDKKSGTTPKQTELSWQTTAGGTYPVQGTLIGGGDPLVGIGKDQQTLDPTAGKKAKPAKVKAGGASTLPTTAAALEKSIATGSFGKILSSVADQYSVAQQSAAQAASGSLTAPATQGAWAEALQDLSGTPSTIGENPSAWLGQNLANAQAVEAPLQTALAAYGQQYQNEQGPILSNLASLGQGLELGVDTAPESAWLSALSSHITSNLSYYGTIPSASLSSLPSSVVTALQQAGGYPGSTAKGLIPLGSLTTKGVTPKVKGGTGAATAASGGGTAPSASPYPT